ncbi:regulatory protein, luxR family [Nocardioides scoriae]|uniref:Regulatory protein, luxR family n=1 Tax=Nocardioides scoriae TaxID=642780 RepID=A0A1H1RC56_9ACTN|nr:LuxR C-terminal-related transcriptional regulator [Nocardioides scoriae]SDS32499.1 regulatory protein, luxR family [Nocardioides scoriae]
MDVIDHGRALGETAEIRGLRQQTESVLALVAEAAATARPEGEPTEVRPLVGLAALIGELRRLEPQVRRSSWVMQPQYAYDPEDPGIELTRQARSRGVDDRLITRPATLRTHPLLPSIFPHALVGPVFLRAMVIDDRLALIGGPDDAFGNRVSWRTTSREIVDAVLALWHDTAAHCRPVLEPHQQPPLTLRQLDVARLLCVGEKDKAIARLLDLSARTVEREVSAILRSLGASSRTEAVLLMRGRGVNGGWSDHDGAEG